MARQAVKRIDFYWDQMTFVLISAIFGLSFLVILTKFFSRSELQCYNFEMDNLTIFQVGYINSYCHGSLFNAQFYLVFILVLAPIIIAPHYLWSDYFSSHFDSFFDMIKKLDCVRDVNTGEYDPLNFKLVNNLEESYCKSRRIFHFYKLKLVLQLTITFVALIFNATYFKMKDFDNDFLCPKNCFSGSNSTNPAKPNCSELGGWPLKEQVMCVCDSLIFLLFLYYAQYVLLGLAILVFITGLVWICSPHATELGAKKIAEFCFASCLDPEAFSSTSWKVLTCYYCGRQRIKLSGTGRSSEKSPGNCCKFFFSFPCFNPRIKNDLDFLLMQLYPDHGQVFKDIQILKYLHKKVLVDHSHFYRFNEMCENWLETKITSESLW